MSWRSSCRAVSALTGRRCCLLDKHPGAHVHGRTVFTAVALTDEDVRRAKQRFADFVTKRAFDVLDNPAVNGDEHV